MAKEPKKPSRRTDARIEVERIAQLFAPLLNKNVQFSFGKFSFPIVIQEIQLAKLTDMKNTPEKRTDENGKMYTPPVMQFVTNEGFLYFILEDIDVVAIANGLRIITAAVNISFKEM
jgi:hypothetical protein